MSEDKERVSRRRRTKLVNGGEREKEIVIWFNKIMGLWAI